MGEQSRIPTGSYIAYVCDTEYNISFNAVVTEIGERQLLPGGREKMFLKDDIKGTIYEFIVGKNYNPKGRYFVEWIKPFLKGEIIPVIADSLKTASQEVRVSPGRAYSKRKPIRVGQHLNK